MVQLPKLTGMAATDDWDIGTLSIAAAGFVENIARNPVKF